MADGLNFGGVDLSGINLSIAKQTEEWASIPMPPSKWELAAEAAAQRDEQADLLSALIERQDAMIEEQKRQAEERQRDRRLAVVTAIIAGATLAATILVPLVMRAF